MNLPEPQRPAFIYCRAASRNPANPNDAIYEQDVRGLAYADQHGLGVEGVFYDIGIKGLRDRPAWQKLLAYIRKEPNGCIVIVDDIVRLSRSVADCAARSAQLRVAGGRLVMPAGPVDGTPEGNFLGNVLAAVSEFAAKEAEADNDDCPDDRPTHPSRWRRML